MKNVDKKKTEKSQTEILEKNFGIDWKIVRRRSAFYTHIRFAPW